MLNCLALMGRLVKDPEIKKSGEKEYALFSLAVETGKEETSFFDCVAPEYVVKSATYCHKGDKIAITGSIRQRKFKDKAGQEKSVVQIVVDHIEFAEVKKANNTSEETPF